MRPGHQKTPTYTLGLPQTDIHKENYEQIKAQNTHKGSGFAHTLGLQKTPLDLVFLTFLQVHTLVLTLGHPRASLGTKIAQNRPWNGQNYATCSLSCLIVHLALAFLNFDPAL